MTNFESSTFAIAQSSSEVTSFLSNPANLYNILPQDKIEDWKAEGDQCSFKIKGLAHVSLKLVTNEPNRVVYASTTNQPFAFDLAVNAAPTGDNTSNVSASFNADVNAFMGAMLKIPLVNFLDALGSAVKKKFG